MTLLIYSIPLRLCTVDDAVHILSDIGKNFLMAKLDIKSAFRLIPVRPADRWLSGYNFSEKFYYDSVYHLDADLPRSCFALFRRP